MFNVASLLSLLGMVKMSKRIEECTLLFLKGNNRLLLAMKKQGFGVSKWNGVGGRLRPDESIEQALIRKSEEEVSVTPTAYHKVAFIDFTYPRYGEIVQQNVHVFIGDTWEGEPEETEEMAARWFQVSEIPYDHMWEDDALWLPLILDLRKTHS
jgi:ADP-ribose pyrophosphatase YjhB (NUDIX family)